MSLLITSSKQTRSGNSQTIQLGIEKPYNYINNFQNTLKIPANSEIAVESVKINREPRIQAKDKLMMGWFGKRFHQTSGSSVSETAEYVIPSLVLDEISRDSSSPVEFADILRRTFNDMYTYHPEFNFNKTAVNVSYSAKGEFAGFEVSMETCSQVAAIRLPDSLMVIDPFGYDELLDDAGAPSGYPDFSKQPILFGSGGNSSSNTKMIYDDATGIITSKTNEAVACICPEGMWEEGLENGGGPLSLLDGAVTFVTDGDKSGWWVGLARAHTNHFAQESQTDPDESRPGIPGFNETYKENIELPDFAPAGLLLDAFSETDKEPFGTYTPQYWDYVVHHDKAGGYVRVYHAVYNENIGKMRHEEIKYYLADNVLNSSHATGTPITSAKAPTSIVFTATNTGIRIDDENGEPITNASVTNASTQESIPKPIDQSCWRMYPKVCFDENASGKTIQIKSYMPRTATTSPKMWGDDWYGRCVRKELFGQRDNNLGPVLGQTTPQKVMSPIPQWTGGAQSWPIGLVQRSHLRPDMTMGQYEYPRISGSGLLGKEIVNIVGTDSPYTDAVHGNDQKLEWQPNIAPQIGNTVSSVWPYVPVFGDGTVHGSFTASFVTAGVPATTSDRAAYIRVPTLTHESLNGATGNQSKILFQVPKFDNAGNSTGALQFQAQDRLYVDLKNAAEINMTDVNVQFVGSDEKFADDLTGQSSVLFHIRPKV